jgi:WD40 repeat protein
MNLRYFFYWLVMIIAYLHIVIASLLECVFNHFCCLLYLFKIQFDYLKSLEIEEKINKIRWCHTANGALFLLSTNDKTIKFWKVGKALLSFLNFSVLHELHFSITFLKCDTCIIITPQIRNACIM